MEGLRNSKKEGIFKRGEVKDVWKTEIKDRENLRAKRRKIEILNRIKEIKYNSNQSKISNTQKYFAHEEPIDIEKTNM